MSQVKVTTEEITRGTAGQEAVAEVAEMLAGLVVMTPVSVGQVFLRLLVERLLFTLEAAEAAEAGIQYELAALEDLELVVQEVRILRWVTPQALQGLPTQAAEGEVVEALKIM